VYASKFEKVPAKNEGNEEKRDEGAVVGKMVGYQRIGWDGERMG